MTRSSSMRSGGGLRAWVGRGLERGAWRGPVARTLSAAYARHARVERSLSVPDAAVIGVSGATLGGSGVTPMCGALALALTTRGRRVAVVGHGYRAGLGAPKVVEPGDRPEEVGDDALDLARLLRPVGGRVVVGPTKAGALSLAADGADVVILDGVLQRRGVHLDASLLVLDASSPWGAGDCPPAGDLRAAPRALLAGASEVLWVPPPGGATPAVDALTMASERRVTGVPSRVSLSRVDGRQVYPDALAGRRVGLIVGVARPARIAEALAGRGIRLARMVALEDHAPSGAFQRQSSLLAPAGLDAWVTTSKCATKLGESFAGAPVLVVRRHFDVPGGLLQRLLAAVEARVGRGACLSARGRAMVPPCSGTA